MLKIESKSIVKIIYKITRIRIKIWFIINLIFLNSFYSRDTLPLSGCVSEFLLIRINITKKPYRPKENAEIMSRRKNYPLGYNMKNEALRSFKSSIKCIRCLTNVPVHIFDRNTHLSSDFDFCLHSF